MNGLCIQWAIVSGRKTSVTYPLSSQFTKAPCVIANVHRQDNNSIPMGCDGYDITPSGFTRQLSLEGNEFYYIAIGY